ncbi:hypothetical protein EXIGLDRAFT_770292 [Exidia glandulosa HHB12029]|uniref:Uncharacterized protein n=1 Tax=Exidia glandulosa HHB12029 TaxID=1314781 RepID=A0A165GUE6_EXIGL|nr:hypothetical protein EXIGLDRAFT_770292 [Exidia glandulosa HHB12029]
MSRNSMPTILRLKTSIAHIDELIVGLVDSPNAPEWPSATETDIRGVDGRAQNGPSASPLAPAPQNDAPACDLAPSVLRTRGHLFGPSVQSRSSATSLLASSAGPTTVRPAPGPISTRAPPLVTAVPVDYSSKWPNDQAPAVIWTLPVHGGPGASSPSHALDENFPQYPMPRCPAQSVFKAPVRALQLPAPTCPMSELPVPSPSPVVRSIRDTPAESAPSHPALSITIPAPTAAPAPSTAAITEVLPAPVVPVAASQRSLRRQSSRMSVDADGSPSKSKGKAKATSVAVAGPSGPPPASAVTGVALAPVDSTSYKAAAPVLTQNFDALNDGLAKAVATSTERFRDLTGDIGDVRALVHGFAQDAIAARQGDPAAPSDLLCSLIASNNDMVEEVTGHTSRFAELLQALTELQEWREQMTPFLQSAADAIAASNAAPGPVLPSHPIPSAPRPTQGAPGPQPRPLKRLRAADNETSIAVAPPPTRAAGAYVQTATLAPVAPQPVHVGTIALAPPPLPPVNPAPVATAPPPSAAVQVDAPAPSPSVLVGPLKWAKDISGQLRTLITIMPRGATVSRNVRAARAGANYVHAVFPSIQDAYHFVAMWNMARPAGYENVEAILN